MLRLDEKLSRIRHGAYRAGDFILGDARDGDLARAMLAVGHHFGPGGAPGRPRSRAEFLATVQQMVEQDVIDLMLTSLSSLEVVQGRGLYDTSRVTPAIRANDNTDHWQFRGARYDREPPRPFRSSSLSEARRLGCDLGLYGLSFSNDRDADLLALRHYAEFREDARRRRFRHALEVGNPGPASGLAPDQVAGFVNDAVIRALAGLTSRERPEFLRLTYNGPAALEELASFDPSLVLGVQGGAAGTTRDALELVAQTERFGGRLALLGRRIAQAEDPRALVSLLRAVADGAVPSAEAVRAYHGALQGRGLTPLRPLDMDSQVTDPVLRAAA
ncbi:hypothetical protein [Salipiger marinus]|uniref:Uncharacterized protein n=1 Tax=Salipiger marinus TaxID=555512 RepID=A0A1G8PGW0_9RHOB|nr:hypothetical protein [Salipiger marinus]SDI91744.1 hypothetical protein SAMN04487993_1012132 [Salipiger marinus]